MSEWISVDDRLPKLNEMVLVYSPPTMQSHEGDTNIHFDFIDEEVWYFHNESYEHFSCVAKPSGSTGPSEDAPYTHWMPLPKPPEVTK